MGVFLREIPLYPKYRPSEATFLPFSASWGKKRKNAMSSPELIMEVGRQMADNSGMAPAGDAPAPRSTTPDAALALLLERSRGGDATAMEAIYLRFKGAFFNLAYRYGGDRAAAEDLLCGKRSPRPARRFL
jgi:hypothetical protein